MMGADVSCVRAPGDSQWPQGGSSEEPSPVRTWSPPVCPLTEVDMSRGLTTSSHLRFCPSW